MFLALRNVTPNKQQLFNGGLYSPDKVTKLEKLFNGGRQPEEITKLLGQKLSTPEYQEAVWCGQISLGNVRELGPLFNSGGNRLPREITKWQQLLAGLGAIKFPELKIGFTITRLFPNFHKLRCPLPFGIYAYCVVFMRRETTQFILWYSCPFKIFAVLSTHFPKYLSSSSLGTSSSVREYLN